MGVRFLVWDLCSEIFVWDPWFLNFGLGFWGLGSLGLGSWVAGTGLLRLGESMDDTWGNVRESPRYQLFQLLYKNLIGKPRQENTCRIMRFYRDSTLGIKPKLEPYAFAFC